jgi:hypothetical protein
MSVRGIKLLDLISSEPELMLDPARVRHYQNLLQISACPPASVRLSRYSNNAVIRDEESLHILEAARLEGRDWWLCSFDE